jgi:hypothetical protein
MDELIDDLGFVLSVCAIPMAIFSLISRHVWYPAVWFAVPFLLIGILTFVGFFIAVARK